VIRVLHFSDIHVERDPGVVRRHLAGLRPDKRALGWANLILRRRRRFADAPAKVAALAEQLLAEQPVDYVLCTGDYTALGTDGELEHARRLVAPLTEAPFGYGTVPGNHDVYVDDPGDFQARFGDLLSTDLPGYRAPGSPFPWVRLVGDALAVIGVNSARPNPQPWRSSGRIPDAQLTALEKILGDPALHGRLLIVATHYAPRLEDGRPDAHFHGLRNADAFLRCLALGARSPGIVAFGHVHRRYHVRVPECPLTLSGAGSATDAKSESLWLYEIDGGGGGGGGGAGRPFPRLRAFPGDWTGSRWELAPEPAWQL